MKNYKLVYNQNGKLQDQIEEDEFYVAQQENKAVAFTATFPAFLVGSVRAYLQFKGGGDVVDCGNINLNNNSVTVELDAKYLAYNFLKIGFEVITATKEIRFEPVTITVDGFVNISGNSSVQGYTVTVKIGTVTVLEPDEEPYVTNSGTEKDAILNFGIPATLPKPIASVFEDEIDNLKGTFDENGDGKVDFYAVVNSSELRETIGFTPYLLLVSPTWNDGYVQYDTCQIKIQDGKTYRRYYAHLTPNKIGWTEWSCDLEAAEGKIEALETRVSQKLDKDTIVTEAANNTLVLEENQDARLGETSSLVLSMPESIGDWYRSTFSFQSGESATSLVYGYTPLDWKGDDVTSDGRFVPEPFSTYEVDVKNLGINGIRARVDKIAGYSSVDVEGTVLSLPSSAGKALRDYKIYGNSVQNGEPTEEAPVAVQSVGNYNGETGKYDVPIVVSGKNLLDPATFNLGVTIYAAGGYNATIELRNYADGRNYANRMTTSAFPVKPNCQYSFTNENTDVYWVNRMVEVLPNGNNCFNHALHTSESKNYNCYSFTTREDTVALHLQVSRVDGEAVTQADVDALRIMLLEGTYTETTMPGYEPYREPVTTTISLEEPLRKVGDVADYIDYAGQKTVRQVEVLDDTGALPLEESYTALGTPVEEPMKLPAIDTELYDNVITVGTEIQPSNVKVTYFKKG